MADVLKNCAVGEVVEKVWGREVILINSDRYCAKHLYVNPGWQCSLHRHLKKDETFYAVTGCGWIFLGGRPYRLQPGALVRIPPGEWHSVWNDGAETLILLEVSTHHDDRDVEREAESAPIEALPHINGNGRFER